MNIKTIWLFVTNQCNLDCSYCYIKKNPRDINTGIAYRVIDELVSNPFFNEHHIVLFGGEPLLKMDLIKKIVVYGYKKAKIKNKKITFSIYSNGTLMNERNVKTLYELGIGLDLSLDGIKESQDQERLFKNKNSSFDIISQNIPTLLKYYPNSMVHACVTPSNVKYLSKNIDFFYNKDFKRVYIQPIMTANWTKEDLTIFQKELSKIFINYKKLIKQGQLLYLNILGDYIKKIKEKKQKCVTPCPAGIYNYAFSVEGEIFPCHRFVTLSSEIEFKSQDENYKLGNINDGITNKKLYKHFINFKFNNYKDCKDCEINKMCCSYCHWEHYYKNKNFTNINKTVCIIQKIIINEVKKFLIQSPDLQKINFCSHFRGLNIPKNKP